MSDVIDEVKKRIEHVEKNNKKTLDLGKAVDKKIDSFENQFKSLRKTIEEKDALILIAEERLTDLENKCKANNHKMENKIKNWIPV